MINAVPAAVATLADRITASLPSLTAAERRAARALLARYPTTGIETVALFAERAAVSAPTILRFIAKLGFDNYAEFRRALREELEAQGQFRLSANGAVPPGLAELGQALAELVRQSLGLVTPGELERLVELLADERRRVYLLGGEFTEIAARHLDFHLRKIRPGVVLLDRSLRRRADHLVELRRRDLLVVFDIRRYQASSIQTARVARGRGALIALFTDQWMSDIAQFADLVFRARIDAPSPWDSQVGLLALVEAVVLALDARLWSRSRERLEQIERLRGALQTGEAALARSSQAES